MRIFKVVSGILVSLILLIVLILWWVTTTESGLRWAVDRAEPWIKVAEVNGDFGNLTFKHLTYSNDTISVKIASGSIKWSPLALLKAHLDLVAVNATGVEVATKTSTDNDSESFSGVNIPLDVTVTNLDIRTLSVRSDDEPPVKLEQISLQGKLVSNVLDLGSARIRFEQGQVDINGQIDLLATPASELNLYHASEWKTDQADYVFSGSVNGTWAEIELQQTLSAPVNAQLKATLKDPLGDTLSWQARIEVTDADSRLWFSESPFSSVAGVFTSNGSIVPAQGLAGLDWDVESELEATTVNAQRWEASIDIESKMKNLVINKLQVVERRELGVSTNEIDTASLNLRGEINEYLDFMQSVENSAANVDLSGDWQFLRWPLVGEHTEYESKLGSFNVTGTPEQYRLQASARLSSAQVAEANLSVDGQGDRRQFKIEKLQLVTGTGSVYGTGGIVWTPQISWEAELDLNQFNPALFSDQWPGSLSAKIATNGRVDEASIAPFNLVGEVQLSEVGGMLRGRSIDGSAKIVATKERMQIQESFISSGASRISASGTVGQAIDLSWQLNSPDLRELMPEASGQIDATGTLKGSKDKPVIDASLTASNAQYQQWYLGALRAQVEIDTDTASSQGTDNLLSGSWDGDVTISDFRQADKSFINNARAKLSGTAEAHQFSATIDANEYASGQLSLTGGLSGRSWQAELSNVAIRLAKFDNWALVKPVNVTVSADGVATELMCLEAAEQSICASVDTTKGQIEISGDIERLQLAQFDSWIAPYDISSVGTASAAFELSQGVDGQTPQIKFDLDASNTALTALYPSDEDDEFERTFDLSTLTLSFLQTSEQDGAVVSTNLVMDEVGKLGGRVNSPAVSLGSGLAQGALDGSFDLQLSDLSVIPPTLIGGSELKGALDASLQVGGSVAEPELGVKLDLNDATARVEPLGILLREIEVTMATEANSVVGFTGKLRSGDGQMGIDGELDFAVLDDPKARLKIDGENLTLMQTKDVFVVGDVDAKLQFNKRILDIDGSLSVDNAEIDYGKSPDVVSASPDVVLESAQRNGAGTKTNLRFDIDLGQKTHLVAMGLDTMLVGKLELRQQRSGLLTGRGRIEAKDGVYAAYGQELKIDKGNLIFSGNSIDDPNLELDAVKTVVDTRVGVRVRGRAQAPRVDLFSEPSMSDQDILSVLIFNKPVEQIGSQDSLALLRIASSLRGDGGNGRIAQLTDSLQNTLGLTDFELNVASANPNISLGKQISSKFYIGYGYGLLDAAQSLILRYKLSKAWSIQGDLGENSGADVRYQIER